MRERILYELTLIFREVFEDSSIILTYETTAADIEEWDSLEQISLIVSIESQYEIKMNIKEVNSLNNVGEMVDYLVEKVQGQ